MTEFDFDNNDADRLRAYSLKALRTKVQEAETRKQLLFYREDENSPVVVNPQVNRGIILCRQAGFVDEVIAEFIYHGIEESRKDEGTREVPQKQKEAEIRELVNFLTGL